MVGKEISVFLGGRTNIVIIRGLNLRIMSLKIMIIHITNSDYRNLIKKQPLKAIVL